MDIVSIHILCIIIARVLLALSFYYYFTIPIIFFVLMISIIHHAILKLLHHVFHAIELIKLHVLLQKNLTLALCQALLLLSNLHINIVPSFGDMGALGIDICRRSRLRWPHGDGLHASGLADGRDVQPPCWPHAVLLLRHRPRERLHHAAAGVAHSPWASSPPAPDLATGGPDLPHTTPAACSRVRRAPLGLLRAPSRRHERL